MVLTGDKSRENLLLVGNLLALDALCDRVSNFISHKELERICYLWPLSAIYFLGCLSHSNYSGVDRDRYLGEIPRLISQGVVTHISGSFSKILQESGWKDTWEDLWRESLRQEQLSWEGRLGPLTRWSKHLTLWEQIRVSYNLILQGERDRLDLLEEMMLGWVWGPEAELRHFLGNLSQKFLHFPRIRLLSGFFINGLDIDPPVDPLGATFYKLHRRISHAF